MREPRATAQSDGILSKFYLLTGIYFLFVMIINYAGRSLLIESKQFYASAVFIFHIGVIIWFIAFASKRKKQIYFAVLHMRSTGRNFAGIISTITWSGLYILCMFDFPKTRPQELPVNISQGNIQNVIMPFLGLLLSMLFGLRTYLGMLHECRERSRKNRKIED